MGKNDNKELHSILEQLKKSYASVDEEPFDNNEPIDDAEDGNDDFQKLLTNFFSTDFAEEKSQNTYNFTIVDDKAQTVKDEKISEIEEAIEAEEISEDEVVPEIEESIVVEEKSEVEEITEDQEISEVEEIIEDKEFSEVEEIIEAEEISEVEAIVEIEEPVAEPTITENILAEPIDKTKRDEVTAVENVFRIMFGSRNMPASTDTAESDNNSGEEELIGDNTDIVADIDAYVDGVEVSNEASEVLLSSCENNDEIIYDAVSDDHSDEVNGGADNESIEYLTEDLVTDDNRLIEVDVAEKISVDSDESTEEENAELVIQDTADTIQAVGEADEVVQFGTDYYLGEYTDTPVEDVIVSTEIKANVEYSYDPLQGHLSDAAYVVRKQVDKKISFTTRERDIDLNDDDISLLLDFGYDEEITNEAGSGRTNEIKRQKQNSNIPDKSNRLYGFCGNEYMTNAQTKQIKNKYIRDKRKLIIRAALVALVGVILLSLSAIYWLDTTIDHLVFPFAEIVGLVLVALIATPGIIEGIKGIGKLDPCHYSIPSLLLIIHLVYDVFVVILQENSNLLSDDRMTTSGFIIVAYILVALVADILECTSQMSAFYIVSADGKLYSAEKFNKIKTEKNEKNGKRSLAPQDSMLGNNVYKVKQADMANGYFFRTSKKCGDCLRVMYFMGIVPILALILGCVTLIINGNAYSALASVMIIVLMGFPMSFILFSAIPYFFASKKLKESGCAIVGEVSADEYAIMDTLMFDDCDAVKITESVEIRPENNADVSAAIRLANRVFKSLGGPLSNILVNNNDVEEANISIVSVKDNGIELYMDSHIHVVIGDKNFLAIHGMKVTSDNKITASSENRANTVIYVAFNGVPQLGYIVASKIKDEFSNTVRSLQRYGIKTSVSTYSPLINDYYFEINKPSDIASPVIFKPTSFENKMNSGYVDGGIYALDKPENISDAVIESKKMVGIKAQNKSFSTLMAILGMALGILCVIILAIPENIFKINILACVIILIFNAASIFGVILRYIKTNKKQ